jgi:hypothetical protein
MPYMYAVYASGSLKDKQFFDKGRERFLPALRILTSL